MGLPLACLVALCLALTPARSVELRRGEAVAGSVSGRGRLPAGAGCRLGCSPCVPITPEGRTRNHGHNVCSTWGDFHYKTFDGDVYRFPGLCDYNLASDCRSSYKEFAVHVKRSPGRGGGHPQFQHILLMIKDDTIYLTHQLVVVNGAIVTTPHYSSGLLIEKNDAYTKVFSRAGLSLIWNREDSLMLELDSKFRNHTCGLCGDYNGLQNYSEFLSDGVLFSAIEFGNMQKIIKPEEVCDDPEDVPAPKSCSEHRAECEELLTAMAFEECLGLVPLEPYVQTCMQDRCQCPPGASCMCSTIAEFSRQCSHAGGRPGNWRTATLCPKSCPGNMVYMESGSPCMDTCSHLEISSLCEEHRMDGCFCPEGTVYDDMAGKGCIPVSQCHCKLHGHLYAPGQKVTNNCEHCVCNAGRWVCKDLPCPGTCALEGGSHITTFDGKKYTFHGDCYYVLTKDEHNDSYALLGELAPCGSTDKQTCLKTVVLLADKKKNVVAFKSDGSVLLNELQVNLPHVTASFSIFQPSSYHLVVSTTFGLRLQVQLVPVMQLFLTLDQASQGRVQGLCGNFNGQESDDFKTAGGLVEATGAGFANTWKAQSNCHDKLDWLDDPCSLNIESGEARPHLGQPRCRYDTCNCQNNEDCMCAALSSYARACATKGVMLWGWRELVCNKDVGSCPKSQVFLYNLTTCQQTCRSLSEPDSHCLKGFAPVDGCGCPDHTFLDEKGRCVPLAKCSCYHRGLYLEAGEVVLKQEERCVCRNGRLHCTQVKLLGQSCAAPKIHVDCNNLTALSIRNPRPVSCQTLAAGYVSGQMDDGRGGCVVEKECPCMHNKHLYNPGDKIKVDCNTCTCQKGRWACTQTGCHGTCTIYGSGHYITFDGKQYDFDGHCSYVATQDYCGQNSSLGSFSIITENVPCGTTGVTCSKAIKIFIGRTELKLEDKHRMVIQRDVGHRVGYTTRDVGQYLVVETSTGIIVIWDKRTTIFIKLAPSYKGSVCGLCGNFDQRSNNDFTTRDNMVVESELDFGNSWKEAPTCPDVTTTPEPCVKNPHRQAWAEKQCSIIKSPVFSICHSKVDPKPFYEACVHDSCSCDTGGDCECFCSAVAAYAQECTKEEACVYWRTPDLCPVFCDYYNPPDECEWHYEPCGNRSFETCRTINGIHSNISVSYLEGCYPRCPADRPIYNEDLKKCVTSNECGCYHEGILYPPGASVPPRNECESCVCINSSLTLCQPEEGKILNYTQDGSFCYWEICGPNATVEKHFNICMSTLPPFSSPTPTTTTTTCTTTPTTTTPTPSTGEAQRHCADDCKWTGWLDSGKPSFTKPGGDFESIKNVCEPGWAANISCRASQFPNIPIENLGQTVVCDLSVGLVCKNQDQKPGGVVPQPYCLNYEINVYCCNRYCASTPTPTTTTTTETPTTTVTPTTTPIITSSETPTPTPITTTTTTTTETPTPTPTITPTPTPVITTTTTVTPTTTPTIITETSTPTPPPTTTVTATSTTSPTSTPEPTTTVTTTTTTSTTLPVTPTTVTIEPTTTQCADDCKWTGWLDSGKPSFTKPGGDFESIKNVCEPGWAANISCRASQFPNIPIENLGQTVVCDLSVGLVCKNQDQKPGGVVPQPYCLNYEINVYCCNRYCASTPTPTTTTTTETPTTTTPTPTPITTTTTTTTETPTPTPTIVTETPTPTPITTTTTTTTETPTPTPTIVTETPTPTPITTTTTTTTETPTPTPTIITETPTPTPITTTTTTITETPTPTPTIVTETPTLTPITTTTTTTTETPTPTPTIITETPTPTPITTTTKTTTETPTPTPTIVTETPTPTPITTTTTITTETPTPTPTIVTETPTPTPITTTTTTTTETPTPTPTIITETPTLTPITTTTTTTTETPTPTPTIITETPTPTPITTTTTTTTETPTPTPTIVTETPTPTPITTTTTITTETPTPTPTIVTETPTPTPITTTTTTTTETPTPTPTIITETPTLTPITTTTTTTTETPTPTPTIVTETPTPTPITHTTTTTTETPTPTPTISVTPPPTPTTTISTETPIPTSTTPVHETTTPESSTPSTSQSTVPSSTESSTLLTTIPTIVETSSMPSPTTETKPTVTTTGGTTPAPPPTPGTQTPGACVAAGSTYGSSLPHESSLSYQGRLGLSLAGDVVYNGTHGETCYYVNCSLSCQLEFFNWSCPSTPSPTPTPSNTPTSTKPPGCPNFDPPRQENETWWLCNCTMAVCKHNNTVELVEVECNPPPMPTCSNNLTPVRVMDPDGCCWHWECDCYCTGWGDPHYVTFDGLYYSYQGNCTYVLVEQIDPKVDNFGVYIDNYHCDINDQVSCPRTLIVRHETQEVLVKTVHMAPMKVQVNKQAVALPYKKYGLQVYESGINYVVDIPELGAVISYNGLSFSIRLPYRLFGNNTKGQCGTCTNSTEDDCVLPSGEVVSNCEVAADEWVVNDPSKPHCPHTTFTTRRPATTPSGGSGHTPNKDCASPLCELIKDSLFAQCHSLAPPEHYYEACRFDSCFVPNSGMECVSLQTYAALCAQEGVCVDWRNHTHGVCSMSCPSHKEYQACGPAEEPTCKSSSSQNNTVLVEGCFCPEGTMSYAPGFDVCVKSCGCVGPDNVPREFGEHFEFDCKDCVCLEGGSGIVCEPKKCTQNSPKCTEDGTYPVTEVDPANTCCNITTCKCNTSLCKEKAPLCALGFDVKSEMVPGRCCPVYSCVPKGVCVLENAEYQPGSPVYSSKCQHCVCTNTTDSATQLNLVSCSHVPCNTTCDIGFELVDAPGECCRKCEQTHCIINRPDNQHFILKPLPPCGPGIPRNETRIPCSTIPMTKIVTDAGCTGKITTNYCSGSCGTFAMYSAEAQALDHKCSCCKEQRTSRRQVVLSCPDGSSRSHTYTHIESCLCQDTVCEIPLAQRRRRSVGVPPLVLRGWVGC
uniref:Mucin 2, oligomeric mucus/gel-forming n=1 Tax=Rhinolophus ferrumequinum TaxID=59479 RepID=A0A671FMS9_RHIFE